MTPHTRRWMQPMVLGVALAAGCSDSGPPRGELGLARFAWVCDQGADWGCGREEFPSNIAVGSTFEASFTFDRDVVGGPSLGDSVQGASPAWIDTSPDDAGLVAVAEGEVALLALQGSTLIDFIMVSLHEVDRIALRRPAEDDPQCDDEDDQLAPPTCEPGQLLDVAEDPAVPYTILEMSPQSAQELEAIPLRDALPLAGRLDCQWQSLDPDRLTVTPRERGRAFVDFHGPSAAQLQVTTLGSSFIVLVRAPGSDEGLDPIRTGGRQ